MLDGQWRKAQRSNNEGACVEVRRIKDRVEVRDSKDPRGPVLAFGLEQWAGFVAGLKNGHQER